MLLDAALALVVDEFLVDLDTPRSLTVKILIDHGEWDQIANLRVDPAHYLHAYSYHRDAAATELLRKCQDIDTTVDRKEAALRGWWQSERDCCRTNAKLSPFIYNGPFEDPRDAHWADFLLRVRGWITSVLGQLPDTLDARFGPGATFSDVSRYSTIMHKMSSRPSVTQSARDIASHVLKDTALDRARMKLCYEWPPVVPKSPDNFTSDVVNTSVYEWVVPGNRFTTALKNALTDRGISIEPSENILCQLPVGGEMRKRLYSAGIDLEEGQAIHRQVACEASKTGRYATLDLSSASDTVSRNLVKLLLPEDWFDLLDCLRSKRTRFSYKEAKILFRLMHPAQALLDEEGFYYFDAWWSKVLEKQGVSRDADGEVWFYLEKFSSMGNGFTFELETLIFLGLAVQTAKELGVRAKPGVDIYVYGDDIIVPTEVAVPLTTVLRWCGFTLNERKSFITGPFRESCGGDYFNGHDVRPYYMKEFPHDPASWITVANGIRRVATTDSRSGFDRLPVKRAWFRALGNIPGHVRRLRGPTQLGDAVIHDKPENWHSYWSDQVRYFRTWVPISPRISVRRFGGAVQLASALYGVPSSGPIPRGSVDGYRLGRIAWTILDERNPSRDEQQRSFKRRWNYRMPRQLYESVLLSFSSNRKG